MTVIRRLHLFHFLNNKVFFVTRSGFINTTDGAFVWFDGIEEKSFGRVVDWILDLIDDVVYERLSLGYAVDDLRFNKFLASMARMI